MASEETVLYMETRRNTRRWLLPRMAGTALGISLFLLATAGMAQTSPPTAYCSGKLHVLGRTLKVDIDATQFPNSDGGYGTMSVTSKMGSYKCLVWEFFSGPPGDPTVEIIGGFYVHHRPEYLIVQMTQTADYPQEYGMVGFYVVDSSGYLVDGTGIDSYGQPLEVPVDGTVDVDTGE